MEVPDIGTTTKERLFMSGKTFWLITIRWIHTIELFHKWNPSTKVLRIVYYLIDFFFIPYFLLNFWLFTLVLLTFKGHDKYFENLYYGRSIGNFDEYKKFDQEMWK